MKNKILTSALILTGFMFLTAGIPVMQVSSGLINIGSFSKSSFSAISRISGLLFLLLFLLCFFQKGSSWKTVFSRIYNFSKVYGLRIVIGLSVSYFILTASVGIMRHLTLQTRAFDLGIFSQAVWNTTQGDLLFSSIKENICLLGDHVSPILILLAPFYLIFSSPLCLIVLQAVAYSLCIYFIYIVIVELDQNKGLALLFSVLMFIYYPMRAALHEDFHPEVLIEPLIILAFLCCEKKRWKSLVLCLSFIVLAKENMFGISFAFGVYIYLRHKKSLLAVSISTISILLFLFSIKVIVPHFSGQESLYTHAYKDLFLFSSDNLIFKVISDGDRWEYLAKVFLPFAFLPFININGLVLIAPIFLQNFLSNNGTLRSFNYHYLAGMSSFLFINTYLAMKLLKTNFHEKIPNLVGILAIIVSIFSILRAGPPEYYYYWNIEKEYDSHDRIVRTAVAKIPVEAIVLTHNNIIPQLSNRKYVYQIDYNQAISQVEQAKKYEANVIVLDGEFWEDAWTSLDTTVKDFTNNGFTITYKNGQFYILSAS